MTVGGQFAPLGQGVAVDGGYRLSGSWSFGSGTGHAQYMAAGFMPMHDGLPQMMDNGMPVMMVALLPRDEVTFTDGWHVQGLKGTGSYDYNVADVFVPAYRTFELFTRDPLRGASPAARMGLMAVTAAGHAAWALGVAKSMLDDVQELAATKFRMSDMASLASRPTFQKDLTHHVCAWRAARAAGARRVRRRRDRRGSRRIDSGDPGRSAGRGGVCHRRRAGVCAVGPSGRRHHLDPGGFPARACVPRHLHRHPARVHQ